MAERSDSRAVSDHGDMALIFHIIGNGRSNVPSIKPRKCADTLAARAVANEESEFDIGVQGSVRCISCNSI